MFRQDSTRWFVQHGPSISNLCYLTSWFGPTVEPVVETPSRADDDSKPSCLRDPAWLEVVVPKLISLRIQICPKKGTIPTILLWGWDWDHQTYSREGYGSLGYQLVSKGSKTLTIPQDPWDWDWCISNTSTHKNQTNVGWLYQSHGSHASKVVGLFSALISRPVSPLTSHKPMKSPKILRNSLGFLNFFQAQDQTLRKNPNITGSLR